ncbi:MAG: hypothetical protein QF552_09110 [Litorilituus sp.]|jgi:hypothetical protein|nr:hypothetical protein [Litorilituus sp.]
MIKTSVNKLNINIPPTQYNHGLFTCLFFHYVKIKITTLLVEYFYCQLQCARQLNTHSIKNILNQFILKWISHSIAAAQQVQSPDVSGYPDGLKNWKTPIAGKLMM